MSTVKRQPRRLRLLAAAAALVTTVAVISDAQSAPVSAPSPAPSMQLMNGGPTVVAPVTVSATSVSVHFPVTVTGFGAAASLSAIVGISTGGGTFSLASTSGLTVLTGYSLSGPEIGFFGNRVVVEEALADRLRWVGAATGSATLAVSVNQYESGTFFNPVNGHYYEAVNHGSNISWVAASNSAATRTKFGMTGYLATITTPSENTFIADKTTALDVWIGASDAFALINAVTASAYANQGASEGKWHWVTGPEAGTQFMTANAKANVVPGRYESWDADEPNDSDHGGEHCAVTNWGSLGEWNDLSCTNPMVERYMVEYGPPGQGSTVLSASLSVAASVVAPAVLTVQPGVGGVVVSSPAGINCGVTCSASFPSGNAVVLTAVPATGQRLESWGGSCAGAGTCTVTMSGAQTVSATFGLIATLPPQLPGLVTQPVAGPSTVAPPTSAPSTVAPPVTSPSSTVAPTPVPADGSGVLPDLLPGESQVTQNGVTTAVEIVVENSTDLVLRGADFELRLAGDCASGCSVLTDESGRQVIELESNGLANVAGEGFKPGTPVYVWLFSEPMLLGELMVLADGSFAGQVSLAGVDTGTHTLQVNGTSVDGEARTANLGVVVRPSVVPVPGDGVLPATGSGVLLLVWVLVLLGAGGLMLTGRRRTA